MRLSVLIITVLIATRCFAQDSTTVNLHLNKLKMNKGESQVTTIVGGVVTAASLGVVGYGVSEIVNDNVPFGGAMIGAGGLFLGTGITMTILGGKQWRFNVKGIKHDPTTN